MPADVPLASNAEDARAAKAVTTHHAELSRRLAACVEALMTSAVEPGTSFETALRQTLDFCSGELLPHAAAEEATLYRAAAGSERARLLVEGMVAEHRVIVELVDEIDTASEPGRACAAAYALRVLFDAHLAKENDLLLPVVAAEPGINLAEVLGEIHELLGDHCQPTGTES